MPGIVWNAPSNEAREADTCPINEASVSDTLGRIVEKLRYYRTQVWEAIRNPADDRYAASVNEETVQNMIDQVFEPFNDLQPDIQVHIAHRDAYMHRALIDPRQQARRQGASWPEANYLREVQMQKEFLHLEHCITGCLKIIRGRRPVHGLRRAVESLRDVAVNPTNVDAHKDAVDTRLLDILRDAIRTRPPNRPLDVMYPEDSPVEFGVYIVWSAQLVEFAQELESTWPLVAVLEAYWRTKVARGQVLDLAREDRDSEYVQLLIEGGHWEPPSSDEENEE